MLKVLVFLKKVCIYLFVFLKILMLENEWIKIIRYCNYVLVFNDFLF